MVYYALLVGAELDGLTNLQPRRGCDDPNFPYYLKVRVPIPFFSFGSIGSGLPVPLISIAQGADRGLLARFSVPDRSSSARTAGRSPPSPPTSPSASKSTCPKDTAPLTSSRRYPCKHHLPPPHTSVAGWIRLPSAVMLVCLMRLACEEGVFVSMEDGSISLLVCL